MGAAKPSPPPTYTTVAEALGAVRLQCWTSAQEVILDMAIVAICDGLAEINPRFDEERFKTTARFYQGRN